MKKLGLGCMRLPLMDKEDQTSFNVQLVEEMIDEFLAGGFTYFDTAYMYHKDQSEIMVREGLVKRHPRESFLLADKMPLMHLKEKEDLERYFGEQLEKTGAGYFDYYLMHNMNSGRLEKMEELDVFGFGMKMKEAGKIKRLGFSFHDDAETLDRILTMHPEVEFVQLQINYLDWDSRSVQSGRCYEVARKHGKDVIIMEPVKGGTLANIPEEAEKVLRAVRPEMSPASWALRFVAGLEGVVMVLSGMSDMAQLKENMAIMENPEPLTKEEQAALEKAKEIILASKMIPCTSCRYCVEGCPKNIPIPELFTFFNEENRPMAEDEKVEKRDKVYAEICRGHGKAGECLKCYKCESACPQHIEITKELHKIAWHFE